jgi:hypothetical protein
LPINHGKAGRRLTLPVEQSCNFALALQINDTGKCHGVGYL